MSYRFSGLSLSVEVSAYHKGLEKHSGEGKPDSKRHHPVGE